MRLVDLPLNSKPREKAIYNGISSLSDAELLAILLRTGYQNNSAIELAYDLLKSYGNLNSLKEVDLKSLESIKGMGKAKSLVLLASIELSKRINYSQSSKIKISSVKQIFEIYEPKLAYEPQEVLIEIFLDAKHNLIKSKELFKGTLTSHLIHPRDIFREAIKENSAAIILVHNHPSGDPTPSKLDIESTIQINQFGKELGIHLIDHIIIGKGNYVSLKSENLF